MPRALYKGFLTLFLLSPPAMMVLGMRALKYLRLILESRRFIASMSLPESLGERVAGMISYFRIGLLSKSNSLVFIVPNLRLVLGDWIIMPLEFMEHVALNFWPVNISIGVPLFLDGQIACYIT